MRTLFSILDHFGVPNIQERLLELRVFEKNAFSRSSSFGQYSIPDPPHQNESWTEVKRCRNWAVSEHYSSELYPKVTLKIVLICDSSVSGAIKMVSAPFRFSTHFTLIMMIMAILMMIMLKMTKNLKVS